MNFIYRFLGFVKGIISALLPTTSFAVACKKSIWELKIPLTQKQKLITITFGKISVNMCWGREMKDDEKNEIARKVANKVTKRIIYIVFAVLFF